MNFHPYSEVFPLIDDADGEALAVRHGHASPAPWLSKDQRAMLSGRISIIQRNERREASRSKDIWISEARNSFHPGDQGNCVVCGCYSSVTHAHHIVPLWMQFDAGARFANNEFAWLCPTHHAGVHLFLQKNCSWPSTAGFTSQEQEALIQIALRAFSWKPETYNAA